jgi:hypothetical protein
MSPSTEKLAENFTEKANESIDLAAQYARAVSELSYYVKRDSAVLREMDKICHGIRGSKPNAEAIDSLVKTGRKFISYFPQLKDTGVVQNFFGSKPKVEDKAKMVFKVSHEYFANIIDLENAFVGLARRYFRTKKEDEKNEIEDAVDHRGDAAGMRVLNDRVAMINHVSRIKGHMLLKFNLDESKDRVY